MPSIADIVGTVRRVCCALCLLAQPAWAHNFVGAQSCGSCHTFEYQVWAHSPHARAHLSLSEAQRGDGRCNGCHTNALVLQDGNGPAAGEARLPAAAAAAQDGNKFAGVQCEQCHGPGRYYQPDYVMRDKELAMAVGLVEPTVAQCQGCHAQGTPSLLPFDYKSMWARIDHGRDKRLLHERSLQDAASKKAAPARAEVK